MQTNLWLLGPSWYGWNEEKNILAKVWDILLKKAARKRFQVVK